MKKYFLKSGIVLVLLLFNTFNIKAQPNNDPLYELVFIDEFDSLALNRDKWGTWWKYVPNLWNDSISTTACGVNPIDIAYNYDMSADGGINQNRIYDTTGSGFHRMVSKRQDVTGHYVKNFSPYTLGTKQYKFTTAMLVSLDRFKYGFFEFRYRLSNIPANTGSDAFNAYGPNLWMWHGDNNVNYSEIDIFEQSGQTWKMSPCTHYRKYPNKSGNTLIAPPSGNPDDTTFWHANHFYGTINYNHKYPRTYSLPMNSGNWHTINMEWTDTYLDFYYDSPDTNRRYTNPGIFMDKMAPMSIFIDVYCPAFQYCLFYDNVNTQMPFNYDIDYIKVWQKKQDCTSKTFTNTNSATYQSKVYYNVTVGGSGGSAVLNSGNHHIAGEQFALLNEGFEASGSATVMVSSQNCLTDQHFGLRTGGTTPTPENIKDVQKLKVHN